MIFKNTWDKISPTTKRYILIGGSVYALELVAIVVAQRLGYKPVTAVAISYWIGFVFSFTLQKLVTFKDKRTHHKVLIGQILAYAALVLFNFGFTVVVTKSLSSVLPAPVIRTIALAVTMLWNFKLYKTAIFKESDEVPLN